MPYKVEGEGRATLAHGELVLGLDALRMLSGFSILRALGHKEGAKDSSLTMKRNGRR